jgi:hypothetical protein
VPANHRLWTAARCRHFACDATPHPHLGHASQLLPNALHGVLQHLGVVQCDTRGLCRCRSSLAHAGAGLGCLPGFVGLDKPVAQQHTQRHSVSNAGQSSCTTHACLLRVCPSLTRSAHPAKCRVLTMPLCSFR